MTTGVSLLFIEDEGNNSAAIQQITQGHFDEVLVLKFVYLREKQKCYARLLKVGFGHK
jgi:hypothetical protein